MGLFKSEALQAWRGENSLVDYVSLSHHVERNIIALRDGGYVSLWRMSGRSHDTASQNDVFRWLEDFHAQLVGAAKADPALNISMWTYIHRRRVGDYPDAKFSNPFARHVNDKYRAAFTNADSRVNDLYLAITVRENVDDMLKMFAKAEKPSEADKLYSQERSIKALNSINSQMAIALRPYRGELLGMEEVFDPELNATSTYCSALRWFKYLVDGRDEPVPVGRGRIYDYLSTARPMFAPHGSTGVNRYADGTRRFGMLEMVDVSRDSSEPGQLNKLLKSEHEFVLCQSFSVLSLVAASGALEQQERLLRDSTDPAFTLIQQLADARDMVESGQILGGEHHLTLLAYAPDARRLENSLESLRTLLTACRFICAPVDLSLEAAYWAQLPGAWKWRPRPAWITSKNFCSWSSFHNYLSGKPEGNPWGTAVTAMKTVSGTPLYFNFHVSGFDDDDFGKKLLGNTLILGKSGEGKTATLCFLLTMAQKFDPLTLIWDKDCGTQILVLALGGRYYKLQRGVPPGWNPLKAMNPDDPQDWAFLQRFIRKLAELDGLSLTASEERAIDSALHVVMREIPRHKRQMRVLLQNITEPEDANPNARTGLKTRLSRWCGDGEHAWLFDSEEDTLDFEGCRTFGFDVTDFIEDDEKVRLAAMMTYLTYRTDRLQNGQRVIRVWEEFHKLFEDPGMERKAKDGAKTDRKKNTINIWSSQEPQDAISSKVGMTLIQQTATMMLLANDAAVESEYVQTLRLTEREFEIMAKFPTGSRHMLIKQGQQCAIGVMRLQGWDREMRVFSSTPDSALIAEKCVAEYGRDPDVWLPEFYRIMEENEREKD